MCYPFLRCESRERLKSSEEGGLAGEAREHRYLRNLAVGVLTHQPFGMLHTVAVDKLRERTAALVPYSLRHIAAVGGEQCRDIREFQVAAQI